MISDIKKKSLNNLKKLKVSKFNLNEAIYGKID